MISYELWMLPAAVILSGLGLVAAGYLWGLVLSIEQPQTSDADTDER